MLSVSVPGELPFVNASRITYSTLTIQWGLLPCDEQNGNITGYKVTWRNKTLNISGAEVTLTNLNSSTTYHFQVAAVNMVGTGPLKSLTATTTGISVTFLKN